ncbi:GTP-binding protein TypA/BipA [Halobacteroides halobius DSM 5150]|uniref:Large ribosomal subunit assembly factor BipA n=1 Tax=Halobacteroides halobius (strain ATCC 35273 / DSM 5150 / MD-1) TaxID=748449 RepID=L0K5U9_HALHC|nr:translational GTPase TypA [Halobacteroides halobius]AGB40376.1 GTP-binding protein TypA/BipA [Halobacteroides halobius DSM 5150]
MIVRDDIRNIAIIAHVDHGKTTLVDGMLKQSGIFHSKQEVQERVMDDNDLERERGITILSKNTAVNYKETKINIVDTPGHADFGGEVERILKMVDGVLLVVDAFEGPMPQTKFVLTKALELDLKPVVVLNKIDREDARPEEVVDKVLDLFIDLGATDEQIDFPVIYASALEGYAQEELSATNDDLEPLFKAVIKHIPAPEGEINKPLQTIVTTIEYNDYVGRMALGKINRGQVSEGEEVAICKRDGTVDKKRISKLYAYQGLGRKEIKEAKVGDIVAIAGMEGINIGETIADKDNPEALPFIEIEEPTVSMTFTTNDSPFAGQEGDFVTSRNLKDRLLKELEKNVALRVKEINPDTFKVSGRGELHLSILIETMRREGYEFQVSKPEVIMKEEEGQKLEPIEEAIIDIPEEHMGTVMELLGARKGEMKNMVHLSQSRLRLTFEVPSRGLIGFRSEFLTKTKGEGVLNCSFSHYDNHRGQISETDTGSIVADREGEVTRYGIFTAQERGDIFVEPGTRVYEGMIVGSNAREQDLNINICKNKKLDNMRSAGSDEAMILTPATELSLEESLEYITSDELVEITPKNIRLRKKILNKKTRVKAQKSN